MIGLKRVIDRSRHRGGLERLVSPGDAPARQAQGGGDCRRQRRGRRPGPDRRATSWCMSAADTELANLAAARAIHLPPARPGAGPPRQPDGSSATTCRSTLYIVDTVIRHARLDRRAPASAAPSYWPYGVEQLCLALARARAVRCSPSCPATIRPRRRAGGAQSTLSRGGGPPAVAIPGPRAAHPTHAHNFLTYCGQPDRPESGLRQSRCRKISLRAGLYWPGLAQPALRSTSRRCGQAEAPVAAITSSTGPIIQSGNLDRPGRRPDLPRCKRRGINPLPLYMRRALKDPASAA